LIWQECVWLGTFIKLFFRFFRSHFTVSSRNVSC
jgi:hypothetical protein